jgi:hypothetical protein
MKVIFVKDHLSGIKKGTEKDFNVVHANRLIEEGYCEEVGAKKPAKKDDEKSEKKNSGSSEE